MLGTGNVVFINNKKQHNAAENSSCKTAQAINPKTEPASKTALPKARAEDGSCSAAQTFYA